jgi:hypothetical protein
VPSTPSASTPSSLWASRLPICSRLHVWNFCFYTHIYQTGRQIFHTWSIFRTYSSHCHCPCVASFLRHSLWFRAPFWKDVGPSVSLCRSLQLAGASTWIFQPSGILVHSFIQGFVENRPWFPTYIYIYILLVIKLQQSSRSIGYRHLPTSNIQ